MMIAKDILLMLPWRLVESAESDSLRAELSREVASGHPLYGVPVVVIACRDDCDDVLIEYKSELFAVVRLTWTGRAESDPRWPDTRFFGTLRDWIEHCMKPDASDY
jgi:hypothetical protein